MAVLRRVARDLGVVVGIVLGTCCAPWVGLASAGMDDVLLGKRGYATHAWDGWSLTPSWFALLLLYALTFPLVSAVRPLTPRERLPVFVAVWMALVTAGGAMLAYSLQFFVDPDEPCTYHGCWPGAWPSAAAAVPLVVTLVVWAVLSLRAARVRAVVRLVVPPVVFLVLSTALAAVWTPYVIPVLLGSPPF